MTLNDESQIAWVLMAVVFGGGEKQASIESIISAADYVNHAIIKYDELFGGIHFLLQKEIIYRSGSNYKLSKRVLNRYKSIKGNNAAKYWKVTEEIIIESKDQQDIHIQPLEEIVKKNAYQEAVNNYIERNKVK
ncbi:MAG: hypothetical protein JW730_01925 [Anaerolineales bacterium]|nr:hypothetical protein [Anaerolineales bacterium]